MMLYKIRRRSDGKFSTGGRWPSFKATGKTWGRIQDIVTHYGQINPRNKHVYDDCEVVFYEEDGEMDASEFLGPELEAQKIRKEEAEIRQSEYRKRLGYEKDEESDRRVREGLSPFDREENHKRILELEKQVRDLMKAVRF